MGDLQCPLGRVTVLISMVVNVRDHSAHWSSRSIGCTMRSGEYDLIAPAAVGEQMTCERSAPTRSAEIDAKNGAPV